jgi:hypothetical protein
MSHLSGFTFRREVLLSGLGEGNRSYPMTTYRREVFQPEELSILGSAFDQIWASVASELGDIDPFRKAAARKRLANIMVLLARLGDFDAEEMKRLSIRIFRSIEKPNECFYTPTSSGEGSEGIYGHDHGATQRAVHQEP